MIHKLQFKNGVKKSIIDDFMDTYKVDPDSGHHVAECVRKLSIDEQLELFEKKLLSLLKFAYKKDMRIQLCRSKQESKPCDFTEFSIEVPNKYSNLVVTLNDGTIDDDPLIEILFTIQKINKDAFIETLDDFGDSMFRASSVEIWISYEMDRWASVGLESVSGEQLHENYIDDRPNQIVGDADVLDVDICEALEKILKNIYDGIVADKMWHTWFILQGIDIDEVFLWKLS